MHVELKPLPSLRHGEANQNTVAESRRKNRWIWVAFGALLVLYVFSALRVKPVAALGTMHERLAVAIICKRDWSAPPITRRIFRVLESSPLGVEPRHRSSIRCSRLHCRILDVTDETLP